MRYRNNAASQQRLSLAESFAFPVISLSRYRTLFAVAEIPEIFAASLIGRLPIGLTGLALLLLVQTHTGSFAEGGGVTGCYVAGLALAAPFLGRLIDRRGPARALLCCAILFPAALLAVLACVLQGAPTALTLLFAIAAGAAFPPITACMRSYFSQRFADEDLLSTAYSVESVLIEIVFILGPMIVALLVAFSSAAAAVGASALSGCLGTLLFIRTSALRRWRIDRAARKALLGPLGEPRFTRLIFIVMIFAAAFGFLEIGVTAYATTLSSPALAGLFLGLMSAGSAVGGLAYGSRTWAGGLERQFAVLLTVMGLGLALLLVQWAPRAFGFFAVLAGVVMAPVLIVQSMLVAKCVSAQYRTEAFTWSASALLSGVGIGLAVGGAMVERLPYQWAFGAGAASALMAAAGVLPLLRTKP